MATEHEELVAEIKVAEHMPIADRLKLAKKRRGQQLKVYMQYEKQLSKELGKKGKKSLNASDADRSAGVNHRKTKAKGRLQFAGNILMLDAATRNDITEVKNLLNLGVNPDTCNEDGLTTLHQCCIDGLEELLKLLLDNGANVNAQDSEKWTPLHAAATCGHVKFCKYLCDYGADLLAVNADGNMPYDLCEDGETLDFIESEMAKRGITQELIDETRMSTENMMLAEMQNIVNNGGSLELRGPSNETPMHVAACNGYVSVLEFLLSHGASVEVVDKDDWKPIHCAVCWGQVAATRLLLENGADIEATTRNGDTVLDLCDDPDMSQTVLDLIDEIKSTQQPQSHDVYPHGSGNIPQRRNSSIRRGSAGIVAAHSLNRKASLLEKDTISAKDARGEAARFREMMARVRAASDDDDDDDDNVTVMDAVTLPSPTDSVPKKPKSAESKQQKATNPSSVQIWLQSDEHSRESQSTSPSLGPSSPATIDDTAVSLSKPAGTVSAARNNGHLLTSSNNNGSGGTIATSDRATSSPQPSPTLLQHNNDRRASGTSNLLDLKKQRARERQERMQQHRASNGAFPTSTPAQNGPASDVVTVNSAPAFNDTRRRKFTSNRYDITASDEQSNECCLLM